MAKAKKKAKRNIIDARKGIRKNPPKVRKDIDTLVDKFLKSADYKQFKRRFKRR